MEAEEESSLVTRELRKWLNKNPDIAVAVAAVKALTEAIKASTATTMMGLKKELEQAVLQLKQADKSISLISGCELFTKFVTRTALDVTDFQACKLRIIQRGEHFLANSALSRDKIGALLADRFVTDDMVILVHGHSRAVWSVLSRASAKGKRFTVVVTKALPEGTGTRMAERLDSMNIPYSLIHDSFVAHILPKVDVVLMGAEGVVENGGIINAMGTYGIALAAEAMQKPLYVAAESFKFVRLYPLDQGEIPQPNRSSAVDAHSVDESPASDLVDVPRSHRWIDTAARSHTVDYTPPQYITLLFTDLGVLTPAAVSDELIKLYM